MQDAAEGHETLNSEPNVPDGTGTAETLQAEPFQASAIGRPLFAEF
jgi:hypothetical protein